MVNTESKNGQKLDFDGQRQGENLLFVFRRHIIAMRKGFYVFLSVLIITSLPVLIFGKIVSHDILISLLKIAGIGLVTGLLLLFYHFILWYFTIFIVTDQRLRQVTQTGFFGKGVIDLQLSKIQNISYNVPGFSGEIFKFGTIVIQTYVGDLVIRNVEHPDIIYNKLLDATNDATGNQGDNEETN